MHPLLDTNRERSRYGRLLAVTRMRNEGPFVVEWVAHYIALGFTDIMVAYNNCTDYTNDVIETLGRLGFITPINNEKGRGAPQPSA
ncbi:MAG: glycosyltransferase family 2 protein [Pseudomonadota bacterium]